MDIAQAETFGGRDKSLPAGVDPVLRTGVWYGDRPLQLTFPPTWDVTTLWPRTPLPVTDQQIEEAFARPVGRPPLSDLCRGRSRPLVIVDDMNRPTPAARVMPWVLQQFAQAGIRAENVTILMASGSHGRPRRETMVQKIGPAAAACRFALHNPRRRTMRVGRTSFGTPVLVNREVVASDFVMGIGGLYPNNTTGYGGGSKLAIGVLDLRVISELHHRTLGSGWGAVALDSSFRKELDEIAKMIGLDFLVTIHINADREVVRIRCGDPWRTFPEEVAFARAAFRAPPPRGANVVIANAFPNDLSLTFALVKGDCPLRHCAPRTSRILIAACSEGEGYHGVYPVVRVPRLHAQRDRLGRLALLSPGQIAAVAARGLRRLFRGRWARTATRRVRSARAVAQTNPMWLYRTTGSPQDLPATVRGARIVHRWTEVLDAVAREQSSDGCLKVVVYPCSPLQILDDVM